MARKVENIEFNIDVEKEKLIDDAIRKVGDRKLKPIKDLVGEEVSYEDIKMGIIKNILKKRN